MSNTKATEIVNREIISQASMPRTRFFKERYLNEPLMVDIEYIKHYTTAQKKNYGLESLERRAQNHAYAISNMTPVIHAQDLIVGNKTRFIRGAIPYLNYAAEPFLKEIRKQEQDAQSKHNETGQGGGIAKTKEVLNNGYTIVSGKFLMSNPEYDEFKELCEYWEDKCFMEQSKALWESHFEGADFIKDGWNIGLYTAPHEPCPEGRLILNYEYALQRGYNAIIQDIEDKIKNFKPQAIEDSAKLNFWRASLAVMKASIVFVQNYAKEAQRLADIEQDIDRKIELLKIRDICQNVPMTPPKNFREALQSFWFTYLLGHIEGSHLGYSPGRLDMVLYPYYKNDTETSFEEAVSLFEELFVKMTQIEYIASLSWQGLGHGNLYQNLILGGIDENGNKANNEISLAVLQAQINVQMTQPTLSIWYDEKLDDEFLLKAAECVKTGVGFPAFFNQKTYVEHEMKTSGLPIEIIRKRCAIGGCTEPTLQGMAYGIVQAGFINHGKILDIALNNGVDPISKTKMFETREINSYDDFRTYYIDIMKVAIRNWQQYWNYVMIAHRNTVPLIFCSVFVDDCIASGKCMDDGGAILNQSITTLSSGMVNVANSLAVIKKLCYEDRVCTFEELKNIVHNNWQGYENIRKKALDTPHWGNDDNYADDIYIALFNDYCDWVKQQNNYLGKPYDPSMLAISTPVPFGKVCEAFPDGRLRGEPLADGVTSPFPGTDFCGPTAVIRSSAKIDHTKIRGGLLNLKFHPTSISDLRGSKNLLALIKTYFQTSGFQVQFNVVDSKMLRDAQENPDNYRDLVVRVAGFSAYWVEMSKALQDQVIWRTEHNL